MSDWSYAHDLRSRVAKAGELVDPHRQFTVIERAHDMIERALGAGLADPDARRVERTIKLLVDRRWYAEHGCYQDAAWSVEVAERTFETVYPMNWLDAFNDVLDRCMRDGALRKNGDDEPRLAAE